MWLDERTSKEAINLDLLDLHAAREVSYPNLAYLDGSSTLLGRTPCLGTLSISNPGGIYEPLALSMITSRSTKGLWSSLGKIRVAGSVQRFPLETFPIRRV